jgi:hypothetical protein
MAIYINDTRPALTDLPQGKLKKTFGRRKSIVFPTESMARYK